MSVNSKMTAIAAQLRRLLGTGGTYSLDSIASALSGITKRTAATYTPGVADQTIAAGQYLAGAQTVAGDANLVGNNIRRGVTIFGTSGTADVAKPTQRKTVTPVRYGVEVEPDEGYTLNSVWVNGDENLRPGNIKEGVTIFGQTGEVHPGITPSGTKEITANGVFDVNYYQYANVNVAGGSIAPQFCVGDASDGRITELIGPWPDAVSSVHNFVIFCLGTYYEEEQFLIGCSTLQDGEGDSWYSYCYDGDVYDQNGTVPVVCGESRYGVAFTCEDYVVDGLYGILWW